MGDESEELGDRQLKLSLEAELESLKRFRHVQPRIDPDYYQAEINEMITLENQPDDHDFNDLTRQAKIDWYRGTRNTCSKKHEKEINEFLAITRNVFEPFKHLQEGAWDNSSAAVPLESDAVSIEYLSEHNWDVEAAYFHLVADMSLGKESVFVKKLQDQAARQPAAALFSEMKDRIFLRGSKNTLFGAYDNPATMALHGNKNVEGAAVSDASGAASSASSSSSSSSSASSSSKGDSAKEKAAAAAAAAAVGSYYNFPFPREFALAKMEGKDLSEFLLPTSDAASSLANDGAAEKQKGGAGGRGVAKDKQEIKKRWNAIYAMGLALLRQAGEGVNPVSYSSSAKKDPRASMQDVQTLLDEAAMLSPLLDSPGDSFAEEVRILLSDLTKCLLACRQWTAAVRDMLESPAVHHGPRVDHAATDTTDLKGLLQASDELILRPPEVTRLKSLCLSLEKVQAASKKFLVAPPATDQKAQEDDESKVETSKKGRKKNVSKKKAEAEEKLEGPPKPHLEELNKLLQQARPLPIRLACVGEYEKLFADGWALIEEVDHLYEKSENFRVRDKLRHLQADNRPTLDDLRSLRDKIDRFPLQLSQIGDKLENLIWEGEEWQEEVMAIANDSRGTKSSKQNGVSIKRVEALIHEGERLLFDFKPELDILRARQVQAKEWLDRLKNSFKTKQKGSLRGKSGESKAGVVKMGLADMKMMVEEGSSMLDEGDNARSGATRELNKAQSAVDIAEEWLNRVKEVLAAGIAGGDLTDLRELIRESDEMPVYMEEAVVMKSHLNAMEWAKKAAGIMYVKKATVVEKKKKKVKKAAKSADEAGSDTADEADEEEEEEEEEEEDDDDKMADDKEGDKADGNEGTKEFARPKLAEIQKLAKEIQKIRDQVPTDVSDDFHLPKLSEEKDCISILKQAEEWNNATKRMMQSGTIRKGTRLERVVRFYKEGQSFKLNFESELKPLKTAIQHAERWITSNESILHQLKIERVTPIIIGAEKHSNRDRVAAAAAAATADASSAMNVDGETGAAGISPAATAVAPEEGNVSIGALERIALTAESLSVQFPEAEASKERLADVEEWSARVNGICKAGSEAVRQLDHSNRMNGAHSGIKKKAASLNTSNLADLLKEAEGFHVDIGVERKLISDTINASESWKKSAAPILQRVLSTDISKLANNVYNVASSNVGKISSAFAKQKEVDLSVLDLNEEIDDDRMLGMVTSFVRSSKTKRQQEAMKAAQMAQAARTAQITAQQAAQAQANAAAAAAAAAAVASGAPKPPAAPVIAVPPIEPPFMDAHHRQVNGCLAALQALQRDGKRTGISSPLTVQIDLCIAALEWTKEAMSVLAPPREIPRPGMPVSMMPEKERTWGDSSQESIINLMEDSRDVVTEAARQAMAQSLENSALGNTSNNSAEIRELFESAKKDPSTDEGRAFERLQAITECKGKRSYIRPKYDPKKEAQRLKEKEEGGEGGEGGDEDNDEDDEDEDEGEGEMNERRPSSRKRVRSVKLEEDAAPRRGRRAAAQVAADEIAAPGTSAINAAIAASTAAAAAAAVKDEDGKDGDDEEEEQEEEIDQNKKFSPFKKLLLAGSVALPKELQELVEFWTRCLGGLLFRIYEVESWSTAAKRTLLRSMSAPPASPQKRCFEDVLYLLKYSDLKGLDGATRQRIEDEVMRFNDWLDRAQRMKRREKGRLLDVDELKVFCKHGEGLMFDAPLVSELRVELKKAKNWINRLHATGIEKGLALSSDLLQLLPEAEQICCNMSQYCDSIHATTKSYCLCRQAYFGLMIGCDFCDDWFHITCIGVTKLQADKVEKYTCIRCTIERSMGEACVAAAKTTNKWSDRAEFSRARLAAQQYCTATKQQSKSEVLRLETAITEQKQLVEAGLVETIPDMSAIEAPYPVPATRSAAEETLGVMEDTPTIAAGHSNNMHNPHHAMHPNNRQIVVPAVPASSSLDMDPKRRNTALLARDLEAAKKAEKVALDAEKDLKEKEAFEDKNKELIAGWMKSAQALLWPTTADATHDGAPLGSKLCRSPFDYMDPNTGNVVIEMLRVATDNLPTEMVPVKVKELARVAYQQQFDFSEDVDSVVEGFRWMSWCCVVLNVIRAPPTTGTLRVVLKHGESMKFKDDRILRGLNAILLRAKAWKAKARGFLRFNLRRIELSTANQLLLDGNMIPFTSRVKQVLQITVKMGTHMVAPHELVDGQLVQDETGMPVPGGGAAAAAAAAAAAGGLPVPAGRGRGARGGRGAEKKGSRRGPKKADAADQPVLPLFVSCMTDFEDSSDDEEGGSSGQKDAVVAYADDEPPLAVTSQYAPWSTHVTTPYKELWPVKLGFGAINVNGTMFDEEKPVPAPTKGAKGGKRGGGGGDHPHSKKMKV